MSLWALVAATIIITSQNRDQILAARILNCMFPGLSLDILQCIPDWLIRTNRYLHWDGTLSSAHLPERDSTASGSRFRNRNLSGQPRGK